MRWLFLLLIWCSGVSAYADCGEQVRENVGSVLTDVLPKGLDPAAREALWLIGARESRLRPLPPKGSSGEVGTWQILPSTASDYLQPGEDLSDVRVNARVAADYFLHLLDQSDGDYFLAIASYNYGPRAIETIRRRRALPSVTANYLVFVLQLARESHCEEVLTRIVSTTANQ